MTDIFGVGAESPWANAASVFRSRSWPFPSASLFSWLFTDHSTVRCCTERDACRFSK